MTFYIETIALTLCRHSTNFCSYAEAFSKEADLGDFFICKVGDCRSASSCSSFFVAEFETLQLYLKRHFSSMQFDIMI